MNTHTYYVDETEYVVEFKVTSWGADATWDDPAEGPEIDIKSVTVADVEHKGTEIPSALYEEAEKRVYEEFDFNDALAGHLDDYDDYRERLRNPD